ncbi:tol-pal system protein YbgF [Phenylobacterium sp.]|uniref:tol-pal system protein YbgF n=1 Tax=Phenylobacterium sp. TaxID=1871053 RepID=UPI0035B21043
MPHRRLLSSAAALVLVLATAAPSIAQTPMDDPLDARDARRLDKMEKVVRELRAIVYQGRDSGKPVVVQPAETDFQIQELTRRVNDLEQVITRLNGQLETTSHDLDEARRALQASQAQEQSLTDRVTALEQRLAPPADDGGGEADGGQAAAATNASPGEAFSEARQLMLNGDYDAAERAWSAFVHAYGDTDKGPEGQYWYGKTLSARGAHADAATAYIGAVRGWPKTSWAPDATVELARELVALKKGPQACQALDQFSKRYPKAPSNVRSRAAATAAQAKCG